MDPDRSSLLLGIASGIMSFPFLIIILGLIHRGKRKRIHVVEEKSPIKTRETANWLNVFLSRLTTSGIDLIIMQNLCKTLCSMIMLDQSRPEVLQSIKIAPNDPKSKRKAPQFSEFCLNPSTNSDNSSNLTFYINYQQGPAMNLSAVASGGLRDLPKLFTLSAEVEFLIRFFVARVTITFLENDMIVSIGKDLIIDLEFRPILSQTQNPTVVSISSFLNNFLLKQLRGKNFNVFSND